MAVQQNKDNYLSYGISFGLMAGAAVYVLTDWPVAMGIGMSVGLLVGMLISPRLGS